MFLPHLFFFPISLDFLSCEGQYLEIENGQRKAPQRGHQVITTWVVKYHCDGYRVGRLKEEGDEAGMQGGQFPPVLGGFKTLACKYFNILPIKGKNLIPHTPILESGPPLLTLFLIN